MSALSFAAIARATQTNQLDTQLFVDLDTVAFPPDQRIVRSSGYAQYGIGAGSYISDSLATAQLVIDHPRFAFTDTGGRHFRLFGPEGSIAVEQAGATGQTGVDDRPAIQAALDYAVQVGIDTIEFGQDRYELWASQRTSPESDIHATDGHYLLVTGGVTLRGRNSRRTTLECLSLTGRNLEDNWQDAGGIAWRGNGIFVVGDPGPTPPAVLAVESVTLERLVFRGNAQRTGNYNFPVDPVTGDGWDASHKGFRIQDTHVGDIVLVDTDFIGWKGEMFYIVGYAPRSIRATRCRMLTGNGNAWNIQVDCPVLVEDCEFGDCFQAAEALSQGQAVYRNTVFRDCERIWLVGGRGPLPNFHFRWPNRLDAQDQPRCRLSGCELRNVGQAQIGSWVEGDIATIDSTVLMDCATLFAIEDTRLDIDAWLDRAGWISPVVLNGPVNLAIQVPSSPAGTYQQPVRNTHIQLRCQRTRNAVDADRQWAAPQWNGHLLPDCSIEVAHGELSIDNPVKTADNPPLSFPRVSHATVETTQLFGASASMWHGSVAASGLFTPRAALCATGVDDESIHDLHLPTAPLAGAGFGYAEGQIVRIYKRGASGALRFVRDADPGFVVPQTRVLDNNFDWIDFRWNNHAGRWEECAFWSSAPY